MRTVASPVEGTEVRVEPKQSPGIEVNGVPATVDYVGKADVRVDLVDETRSDLVDGTRSFVVEHVLGVLGLRGVTAANVVGTREEWDFARPEHRFCYAAEMDPGNVVGHAAGLPNPALAEALGEADLAAGDSQPRQTVTEPVTHAANGGEIELRPREHGAGVRFDVTYGDATIEAEVDPRADNDEELIESVMDSKTPYLSPSEEEAVTHSIVDLVSDVAVVGGFDDLVVEAELADAYHELTIGASCKAHENGLVERRRES
ncbi:hypothetical protein [Halorussus litoreus]|uniref:hypothetical protein n=1 Tax=Halorussus litoreus TaxID=1710536 RepID=UPI000E2359BC|nr:hypothetical protein [Halorussus litoreus]